MKNRHSFCKAKELSGPGWVGQTLGKYGDGRAREQAPSLGTKKIPIWPKRRLHFPDLVIGLLRWVRHPGAAASQSTAFGRITWQWHADGLERDSEDQRGKNCMRTPLHSWQAGEAAAGGNLGKHPHPPQPTTVSSPSLSSTLLLAAE